MILKNKFGINFKEHSERYNKLKLSPKQILINMILNDLDWSVFPLREKKITSVLFKIKEHHGINSQMSLIEIWSDIGIETKRLSFSLST